MKDFFIKCLAIFCMYFCIILMSLTRNKIKIDVDVLIIGGLIISPIMASLLFKKKKAGGSEGESSVLSHGNVEEISVSKWEVSNLPCCCSCGKKPDRVYNFRYTLLRENIVSLPIFIAFFLARKISIPICKKCLFKFRIQQFALLLPFILAVPLSWCMFKLVKNTLPPDWFPFFILGLLCEAVLSAILLVYVLRKRPFDISNVKGDLVNISFRNPEVASVFHNMLLSPEKNI